MTTTKQLASSILEVKFAEIASDYQYDPNHEDYRGYLNTSPEDEWDLSERMAFTYMIDNHRDTLYDLMARFGLSVEGELGESETVFTLL